MTAFESRTSAEKYSERMRDFTIPVDPISSSGGLQFYIFSGSEECSMTKLARAHTSVSKVFVLEKGTLASSLPIKGPSSCEISSRGASCGVLEAVLAAVDSRPMVHLLDVDASEGSKVLESEPHDIVGLMRSNNKAGQAISVGSIRLYQYASSLYRERLAHLDPVSVVHRECCKILTFAVNRLRAAYRKHRFSWLEEAGAKYRTTLQYQEGAGYVDAETVTPILMPLPRQDAGFEEVSWGRDSVVCDSGDSGDFMYILTSGILSVEANQSFIGYIDKPGTLFGEVSILLNRTRTATIRSLTESRAVLIDRKNVERMTSQYPRFWILMAASVGRYLVNITNRLQKLEIAISSSSSGTPSNASVQVTHYRDPAYVLLQEMVDSVCDLSDRHDLEWLWDFRETLRSQMSTIYS